MATRPFAFNVSGSAITGTYNISRLAIGTSSLDYSSKPGGLTWWMGPDDATAYVVAKDVPSGTWPTPLGNIGTVQFWSSALNDTDYTRLASTLSGTTITTPAEANIWFASNGYWTSYVQSYTYYRWQITDSKINPPSANAVQASEFVFQLNGVDQQSVTSSATVTNPSGSNPVGEEPPKLVDNNVNTKCVDLNFTTNGVTNFIFQFSSAKAFNGYRWATGNDEEGRDPKSWTIAGSNNGSTWTTLHTVTGFTSTSSRLTYNSYFYY